MSTILLKTHCDECQFHDDSIPISYLIAQNGHIQYTPNTLWCKHWKNITDAYGYCYKGEEIEKTTYDYDMTPEEITEVTKKKMQKCLYDALEENLSSQKKEE